MDLALSLLLVAAIASLIAVGPGWVALALIAAGLAAGFYRFRQGRWQLLPMLVVFLLCGLQTGIWWQHGLPVWMATVSVLLCIPALLMVYWSPLPHTPMPGGTYSVGRVTADIPQQQSGADTRLQAHLWYPANPAPGQGRRRFFSADETRVFAGALKALGGPGFLQDHFQLADTWSFENADPADGRFPLVVFNHGGAMWPATNTSLMEELASHGFVTCSISHPGETSGVLWRDGTSTTISEEFIESLKGGHKAIAEYASYLLCQDPERKKTYLPVLAEAYRDSMTAATDRWCGHSLAVVDWLLSEESHQQTDDVSSHIDPGGVVYCGMSLGGSVAQECCFRDPRAAAGINLDGMNWSFDRIYTDVPVPFLQLYHDPVSSAAQVAAQAEPGIQPPTEVTPGIRLYNDFHYESPESAGSRPDILRVVVPGSAHMGFTDMSLSARGPMRKLAGTGICDGPATSAAVNRLIRIFLGDVFGQSGFDRSMAEAESNNRFVVQRLV